MREKEIREQIWEIIEEELTYAMTYAKTCKFGETPKGFNAEKHKTVFGFYKARMRKRINEVLNQHEAILVYQP